MRALVVAAHPDDEVLGCGGTIARLTEAGNEVTCLILGQGLAARFESAADVPAEAFASLKRDAYAAAGILGCKDVRFADLPDNRFDTVALLDVVKRVEDVQRDVQAEVVFTHNSGDLNIDHVITARAVITACRPVPGHTVRRLVAFEVPSSTEWSPPALHRSFAPNVFVDVELTLARKIAALQAYRNEIRQFPHPRSGPILEALARVRGAQAGLSAAEGFELIREVVDGL